MFLKYINWFISIFVTVIILIVVNLWIDFNKIENKTQIDLINEHKNLSNLNLSISNLINEIKTESEYDREKVLYFLDIAYYNLDEIKDSQYNVYISKNQINQLEEVFLNIEELIYDDINIELNKINSLIEINYLYSSLQDSYVRLNQVILKQLNNEHKKVEELKDIFTPLFIILFLFFFIIVYAIYRLKLENKRAFADKKRIESITYDLETALDNSIESEKTAKRIQKEAEQISEQLEQANIQLKSAYEAKSEFLSNMSHEIRTPLAGIIGITDIVLEKGNLNEDDKSKLEIIKNSSHRLKGIINDILDFSKIQAGKFQIIDNEFSIRALIEDIEKLFNPEILNKKLDFKIKIDDSVEDVLISDELRINQIITNLLGNSVKFTNHGMIELDIHTIRKSDKFITLKISVKDTGIGMSEEVKNTVFEAFTQGELSNTKNFQGTGLGLSITKKLVELLGGEISFNSLENIGTTFEILLNLRYSKDKKIIKQKPIETTSSSYRGKKVLVAEDSNINQMVIKEFLSNLYINVDFAENGVLAVEMAKEKHYDLIFMDLQMPKMDGYEATKRIRQFNGDIPIIALSAAVLKEDIQKSFDVGMSYHLAKPIEKSELYEILELTLNCKIDENKTKNSIKNRYIEHVEFKKIFEEFSYDNAIFLLDDYYQFYKDFDYTKMDIKSKDFSDFIEILKEKSETLFFKNIFSICLKIQSNLKNDDNSVLFTLEKLKEKLNFIIQKLENLKN